MKTTFKKLISLLLAIVMIMTLGVQLVACGGTGDGGEGNGGENEGNGGDGGSQTPGKTTYTVEVTTYGNMPLDGVMVYVHQGETGFNMKGRGETDENGRVSIELDTASDYYIELDGYPYGYVVQDRYKMDATGKKIMLMSQPIDPDEEELWDVGVYELGDVIHDFTLTDIDGKKWTVSDVLKENNLLMLNFWYNGCTYCALEFPYLISAYNQYDDKMEIFAIDDYAGNVESQVRNYVVYDDAGNEIPMNFPKFYLPSSQNMIGKFASGGYPTSVFIDRYGVICLIEVGGITNEKPFLKAFEHFTADNYEQKLIESIGELTPAKLPTEDMPSSEVISEAFDGGLLDATYSEYDDEYAWPFVNTVKDGVTCLKTTNFDEDSSYAALMATVRLEAGQALMFDYLASSQYGYDVLTITVDGKDIYSISGTEDEDEWKTCCTWVAVESREYEIAFVYVKDGSGYDGDDTVYLSNLRVGEISDIPVETYIFRFAALGLNETGDGYNTYASVVLNPNDGFYHVGSENGPLLFADLLGNYTQYESGQDVRQTVFQRLYATVGDDQTPTLMIGDANVFSSFEAYGSYAINSDLPGYVPVTQELAEQLQAYAELFRRDVGKAADENLWLQLCCYYDAYGPGAKHLEDPTKGLTPFNAYEAELGVNTEDTVVNEVNYTKIIVPRGLLYKFTPKTSGVYRVTSNSDSAVVGWIFEGTDNTHSDWAENGRYNLTNSDMHVERFANELLYISHYTVVCPECSTTLEVGLTDESVECTDTGCDTTVTDLSAKEEVYAIDYNNVSLTAYMEAGKEYFIAIAFHDTEKTGSFTFDLTYVGETFDRFIAASPGPFTYELNASGTIGSTIAGVYDVDYKLCDKEGCEECAHAAETVGAAAGTKYYHALNADGSLGSLIYADFYMYTSTFPTQNLQDLYRLGAFGSSNADAAKWYIDHLLNEDGYPERQGCTPVDERLADLLQSIIHNHVFEYVEGGWLKFCYYYDSLG
ncbi:MAG: redoxin domain-containing protein [Clostridia bacterium]|nr:redoxin domain-containing protein [Clostridia bacterium]